MSQRLSFTRGVQLSHDNEATSNANNNASINNNISITTPNPPTVETVVYPEVVARDVELGTSTDTDLEFLKKVISIYMDSTRLYSDQLVICTGDELVDLITILTSCTVEIEAEAVDIDCGCCSEIEIPYQTVKTIWVTDATGTKSVFKYSYPQYLSLFDQYCICLKLVRT